MYPSMPHYNLPACHRAMLAEGVLVGAEVCHVGTTVKTIFADRPAS